MFRSRSACFAVSILFTIACGDASSFEPNAQYDWATQGAAAQVDEPPVSATTAPPGPVTPCGGLVAYVPFKLGANHTDATYVRPAGCPGWSGLEAVFNTTATFNRRKLYTTIGFEYSSNPESKCLASKVEYETYRKVTFNGHTLWVPTSSESITPHWTGSICFWHNYNGSTLADPGVYTERIRARGVRFDGQIVNAVVGARLQSESIP
jgi:hypothetical protein